MSYIQDGLQLYVKKKKNVGGGKLFCGEDSVFTVAKGAAPQALRSFIGVDWKHWSRDWLVGLETGWTAEQEDLIYPADIFYTVRLCWVLGMQR